MFTNDYTALGDTLVTTNDKNMVLPHLWNMGYDAGNYHNNTANPIFNAMKTSSIFVFSGHGAAGIPGIRCYSNYLYSYQQSSADRGMNEFSSTNLANCDLMLFVACNAGKTVGAYKNMVDMARSAGARTSIGWTETLYSNEVPNWLNVFFQSLYGRNNIETAMNAANYWATQNITDPSHMTSTYYGTSSLKSIVLG